MTRPALYAAVLIVVAALRLTAQTPLRFEVASVKQNLSGEVGGKDSSAARRSRHLYQRTAADPDSRRVSSRRVRGAVHAWRGALVSTVGSASAGAPQANVPRFDVQGKPPENTAPADRLAMMRELLEDRAAGRRERPSRSSSSIARRYPPGPIDPDESRWPSLETAVREQLGLRLQGEGGSRRHGDRHIDRPTSD